MTASPYSLLLIRQFEGLRLTAYRCPSGIWTIGYGHTSGVKPGDTIITVRSDTSMIQALIECDSTGQAYLSQIMQLESAARLHQNIRLQANVLTATAAIDSMSIYLTYKDRYRTTETTRTETNTVTVTTNILKSWQKLLMFIGALTLIITAVKLYLKLSL